jgi:hypothetical protein
MDRFMELLWRHESDTISKILEHAIETGHEQVTMRRARWVVVGNRIHYRQCRFISFNVSNGGTSLLVSSLLENRPG